MTAKVSRNGCVKKNRKYKSGDMTDEQKAMGWPQGPLASHTEAKACKDLKDCLEPGDHLEFEGTRPPCNSCKGKMNKLSKECKVSICYKWEDKEWWANKK